MQRNTAYWKQARKGQASKGIAPSEKRNTLYEIKPLKISYPLNILS